jgi:hypothetical protein
MKQIPLLFLFLSQIFLSNAQNWISFSGSGFQDPSIQLITSTKQQIKYSCETFGVYSNTIQANGSAFQRVYIPGQGKTEQVGAPEIPFISKMIAIPECTDLSLSCFVDSQSILTGYNIYPVPNTVTQTLNGTTTLVEEFNLDVDLYSQNQYYPQSPCQIISTGHVRNQKYVQVVFYPIQFNPVTSQLKINNIASIQLNIIGATSEININNGLFSKATKESFLNYTGFDKSPSSNNSPAKSLTNYSVEWITLTSAAQTQTISADYLIITDSQFWEPNNPNSELKKLASHRAAYSGYKVVILNVNDILSDVVGFL